LIRDYPEDAVIPQAQVLLGDLCMGLGDLDAAVAAFRTLLPESGALWEYACFQIAKVFRARGEPLLFIEHLGHYLSTDQGLKTRQAEAVLELSAVLRSEGRMREALELELFWMERLLRSADPSQALVLMDSLQQWKRRIAGGASQELSGDAGAQAWITAVDFASWLDACRRAHLEGGRPLAAAYCGFFEVLQLRRQRQSELARSALLTLGLELPRDLLDARMLGELGVALLESDAASGLPYLERLLLDHGESPHRALAYYGLALDAGERCRPQDAMRWLTRFERECPGHALETEAQLLKGRCWADLACHDRALQCYEEVLRWKHARGEAHVRALRGMALVHQERLEMGLAIPYWQRIYTLYRAWTPYVVEAYYQSALAFESRGDRAAAMRTLEEMQSQKDLVAFASYREGCVLLEKWKEDA
jgi:tetratricopeptide (TPR) repeat protein